MRTGEKYQQCQHFVGSMEFSARATLREGKLQERQAAGETGANEGSHMAQKELGFQNIIPGPELGRQSDLGVMERGAPEQKARSKVPDTWAGVGNTSGLGIETVGAVEVSAGTEVLSGPKE